MKRIAVFGFLFVVNTFFLLSCQKELSQESNLNNATYSLHDDSTKACFPVEVSGNYYNGVPAAGDLNFITVIVNVQKTGNYNIASSSPNGFSFADSGFFSKTGLDTLILKARGIPILMQTNDFVFTADSLGTCGFSVEVLDSTGTGLGGGATDTTGTGGGGTTSDSYSAKYTDPNPAGDGTWHFTDTSNNVTYSGTMVPSTFITVDGINQLNIGGYESSVTNTQFAIGIRMPATTIQTGSYPLDANTASFSYSDDLLSGITDYIGIGSTDKEEEDPSFVNITSYDASSKRIKGSFRCWAEDKNGDPALVKGSFNTVLQ